MSLNSKEFYKYKKELYQAGKLIHDLKLIKTRLPGLTGTIWDERHIQVINDCIGFLETIVERRSGDERRKNSTN